MVEREWFVGIEVKMNMNSVLQNRKQMDKLKIHLPTDFFTMQPR